MGNQGYWQPGTGRSRFLSRAAITMMQTADLRNGDDAVAEGEFAFSLDRRVPI